MRNSFLQPEAILRQLWNHLIASISNDVGRVIGSVLNPLLQLLSSVLILVSLVATLLAIGLHQLFRLGRPPPAEGAAPLH